jgi:hypothetical protein
MAPTKMKNVTFDGDDDDDGREEDDNDEVVSEDDGEEIFKTQSNRCFNDNIGLLLLEEQLNATSAEGNLMVSDWKDSTADIVSASVGDGNDTVFEILCEELQFIRMAF